LTKKLDWGFNGSHPIPALVGATTVFYWENEMGSSLAFNLFWGVVE
jgi:hypothetical protein